MSKTQFGSQHHEMFKEIFPMICKMSDDQLNDGVRKSIEGINLDTISDIDLFNFCHKIYRVYGFYGSVSPFVARVCDVHHMFDPPEGWTEQSFIDYINPELPEHHRITKFVE